MHRVVEPTHIHHHRPHLTQAYAGRLAPLAHIIPGRCLLENGFEVACRVHAADSGSFEIGCDAAARPDSIVVLHLTHVGIVRGRVAHRTPPGFLMTMEVSEERRARIATRLDWYAARAGETAEQRTAPRVVPLHRKVEVRLRDDMVFEGVIVDLSMTGAAIAVEASARLPVGTVIRVGKRYASIVRLTDFGFAVQFKLPFIPETFNERVVI